MFCKDDDNKKTPTVQKVEKHTTLQLFIQTMNISHTASRFTPLSLTHSLKLAEVKDRGHKKTRED